MAARPTRRRKRQEGGYVLLAILFALTLLVIALAVAAPRVTTAVRRTQEDELIHRGEQYALAIRRFYKKFGRYPSSVDQLDNTNNIRFLRRHYLDPLTGKDDWTLIQYGQARPPLGFFGQKVTNIGGVNPSGPGLGPSTIGTGSSSSTSSTFGPNSPSSVFSSPNSGGPGSTGLNSGLSNSLNSGGTGASGASGATGPSGTAGNPISGDQLSGKTFGGGAVVGVSVPSQKESLKLFEQQDHYNSWQFVYDPTMDPTLRGGLGTGAATGIPGATGITGATGIGINPNLGGGLNPTSPGTSTNPGTTQTNPTSGPGTTTPNNPQ
jgi:type II secretory pathway pseudopilin PulG